MTPPKWLLTFFRWFCHQDFVEDIEGDLLEMYEYRVAEIGRRKANWKLFFEVFSLIKLNLLKPTEGYQRLNSYGMFKNYFKVAWRNLQKQKLYSFINIGGLALGIACFLTIFIYVESELSYDTFYEDSESIYKVYQKSVGSNLMGKENFAVVPIGLSIAMQEELPEIEQTTLISRSKNLVGSGNYNFYEVGLFADNGFFEVFSFEFVSGNRKSALQNENSIVLTESFALKLFEGKEALGATVLIDNEDEAVVTGVMKDVPKNSSLQFDYVISYASDRYFVKGIKKQDWNNGAYNLFAKTNANAKLTDLNQKLAELSDKYINLNEKMDMPTEVIYYAKPLADFYLYTDSNFDAGYKGNATYIKLFSYMSIIILLLACINYVNLAVARSIKRIKEVGMRKVIGANRWQIILQFFGESFLIASISLLIGLAITQLLLPTFGQVINRELVLGLFVKPQLILYLFGLLLIVGLLSGAYPALYAARVQPIKSLKGKQEKPKLGLQKFLIVLQYAVAMFLAISSVVIFRQFQFMQNQELGYDKEHIINIKVDGDFPLQTTKEKWLQQASIKNVSASIHLPSRAPSTTIIQKDSIAEESFSIYQTEADKDYLQIYGIQLVAGRMLNDRENTKVCLLNETAVKMLGMEPEEAIGKEIFRSYDGYITIIGVMKDYQTHTFRLDIQPLMMRPISWRANYISVKVASSNLPETLEMLEKSYRAQSPYPFEYSFFEDEFDRLYRSEMRFGKMFNFFTLLSLLIASLGLFGLAAFSATQRTKEIGIRKVLGASTKQLTLMITKEFVLLVVIAFVLASPLAEYAMSGWLEDFAYRISVEWWIVLFIGFITVFISILTVASQSLKAALINPVDSLKSE